ncbi:hypothetical protein [Teredinibacter purpureus]|uniref:hypothetical protein n=1 Tax=Teredinibacter purpureus TaxID=2731756 RepID=UPI0006987E09|nr:hypothetical protein [Teredinibacter purpureus]
MNIPVLLLFFNRRDSIVRLVGALKAVKPEVIYLASDGPRGLAEQEVIFEIRDEVLNAIDWGCEVHTLFSEENLGCKLAVSKGIQWFFSQVDRGIILEDDCIPSPFFFEYCEKMLEKYKTDKTVASIAGRNELSKFGKESHFFSSKFFCWGWASWADRVRGIDVEFGYQKDVLKSIGLRELSFAEKNHVLGIHNLMKTKMVNSWAYSYDLYFRSKKMLHVVPKQNLINNIGIGDEGTHRGSKSGDDTSVFGEGFPIDDAVAPEVNTLFMRKYFKFVYSPLKLLLFPYIGYINKIRKKLA